MNNVLAFFDFDGTMIKVDSFPRFLWFCTSPSIFTQKLLRSIPVLLKYSSGAIDNHTAKEKIFAIFFAKAKMDVFSNNARSFSNAVIPRLVRHEAIERLRWHQKQNHQCILVSASIEEYLVPWAQAVGFSKVLATKVEVDSSCNLTGKFLGKNCNGIEKIKRIQGYIGHPGKYEIYAYGDSKGDVELLRIADHPFYKSFREESLCHG
ncbi:MAG: HAD family hydrolase [Nitrospirae bacterium]|nr:HAD family hydrolase [Nitrospirota bacterium]